MNQSELVATVADMSGESRCVVESVLKTVGDVVAAELFEGGEAVLPGIGKLLAQTKPARTGRNPKTGESVAIPERRVPKFRAAKPLKDALAK